MKNLKLAAFLLGLSLLAPSVYADTAIKSKDELNGTWKLDYTRKSSTATENIKREDTWSFKDGMVTITHIPRDGAFYDQSPVKYDIEEGKLKISLLGRSDRFDIFSVVEKDDKSMVLKTKFGDVYYFSKK